MLTSPGQVPVQAQSKKEKLELALGPGAWALGPGGRSGWEYMVQIEAQGPLSVRKVSQVKVDS